MVSPVVSIGIVADVTAALIGQDSGNLRLGGAGSGGSSPVSPLTLTLNPNPKGRNWTRPASRVRVMSWGGSSPFSHLTRNAIF